MFAASLDAIIQRLVEIEILDVLEQVIAQTAERTRPILHLKV